MSEETAVQRGRRLRREERERQELKDHHVNEQLADYWVSRFRFHGFDYRHHDSILIAQTNERVRSPWGRPTLMLFERIG